MKTYDIMPLPRGYEKWRKEIIALIEQAKYKAALKVNAELLSLYWKIGSDIIKKQNWCCAAVGSLEEAKLGQFKGYGKRFCLPWLPSFFIGYPSSVKFKSSR